MSTDEAARSAANGARTPAADAARTAAQVARTSGAAPAGPVDGAVVAPVRAGDPATIEAEIVRRREHLAATVDELLVRVQPRNLARQGVDDAKGRLRAATLTDQGELRAERVGAVAAALAVFVVLSLLLRRRGRRRRR